MRGKGVRRAPSRFLLALPEELIGRVDVLEPPRGDPAVEQAGTASVLEALLSAQGPV